jgi:hypothetical protein
MNIPNAFLASAVLAMAGDLPANACRKPEPGASRVILASPLPLREQAAQPRQSMGAELRAVEARAFFDRLVQRYQALTGYRDSAALVQVTTRQGQTPQETRAQLSCSIERDELLVSTPASQAARALGLEALLEISPAAQVLRHRYELWLAPHMTLRFARQPLREMRAGVEGELKPIVAEHVVIDEKSLVHVQLQSDRGGEGAPDSSVDLYVDPDSMLVQRVESRQILPDGTHCAMTLEITPEFADGGAAESAKPQADGGDVPQPEVTPMDGASAPTDEPDASGDGAESGDPRQMTPKN